MIPSVNAEHLLSLTGNYSEQANRLMQTAYDQRVLSFFVSAPDVSSLRTRLQLGGKEGGIHLPAVAWLRRVPGSAGATTVVGSLGQFS